MTGQADSTRSGTAPSAECSEHKPSVERAGYQLFVLTVSVLAIAVMASTSCVNFDSETVRLLEWADLTICGLFLVDFVRCLWRAPNKIRYLATWGWLDLLASIPVFDVTRWGRLARAFRILRVLRAVRATRVLAEVILRHRAQNALLAALLLLTIVLFSGSIATLAFETAHPESNIRSAEDALWWAITTVTTVGYGDFYPVTTEGRIVAVVLMVTGVGTFATLAGALASWFMKPDQSLPE